MKNLMTTPTPSNAKQNEHPVDSVEIARAKLAKLETIRERMRRVNALVRNRNIKGLKDLGYSDVEVNRLLQPDDACPRVFYSDYKLKNNFQQIQTLQRLIRNLEGSPNDEFSRSSAQYEYREDLQAGLISFRFVVKPDKTLRGVLRRAGFDLSPSRSTYERCLDSDGLAAAYQLQRTLVKRMH